MQSTMGSPKEFVYTSKDGTAIQGYAWLPAEPRMVVQIVHGMMEHARRYDRLASFLNDHGIAVYANDHRGHGGTYSLNKGAESCHLGHFSDHDGWQKVTGDMLMINKLIRSNHPGAPVVMLGHSMGSALARSFAVDHGQQLDGMILSGLMQMPSILLHAGKALASTLGFLHGRTRASRLMISMGYGSYSRHFKPKRTGFDWLSSDEAEVDLYVNDPLCGFPCSNGFYTDFFGGMAENNRKESRGSFRKDLPVLILAGEMDPAGKFGKAPRLVFSRLQSKGLRDVSLKAYPKGRHEMLNEVNRDEVISDILEWFKEHFHPETKL
jgi:alpha-beta hydrolase superfamily lysophospholipase